MIKLRSTTGCWTCRLRRKKCDEEQPICNTCAAHDLSCFNGKEKPIWMDGRNNEKAQLEKIKSMVKKSAEEKRHRRVSRLRHQRSHSVQQVNHPPGVATRPPQEDIATSESLITSPKDFDYDAPWHLPPLDDETSTELETALITPTTTDHSEFVRWANFEDTSLALEHSLPLHSLEDEQLVADIFSPEINPSLNTLAEHSTPSNLVVSAEATENIKAFNFATPSLAKINTSPDALNLLTRMNHAIQEANSIVYYLDHILPRQVPTYTLGSDANKGWIYVLLSNSNMLRNATVALSLRRRNSSSTVAPAEIAMDVTQAHYHSMAIRELCHYLPCTSGAVTAENVQTFIEVLATLMQLISYEILAESHEGWSMHIEAVSNMLFACPAMAGAVISAREKQASSSELQSSRDSVVEIAQLLIGVLVFYDVISGASLRVPSSIQGQRHVLTDWNVRTQDSCFCQTSVTCIIADITELDAWKNAATRQGRLSVMELGARSTQLHERISGIVATISQDLQYNTNMQKPVDLGKLHCSLIFASAAMTYLHVVVSGAYVALPEIEESVAKTIDRMIELPEHKWLQYLAWPFCITGCMATEAQEAFFSSIIAEAELVHDNMDSLAKALAIMEQCWRQRQRRKQPVDWATAMESLHRKIVLI